MSRLNVRASPAGAPGLLSVACAFLVLAAVFVAVLDATRPVQATADTWATAVMTTPRNSHTVTVLPDGRLLAVGGWDGADTLASAELYDPRAQAWTPTAALSVARSYHSAVLLPDGRALVAGGWDRGGQPLASAELYDPAAARVWTPVPDMQVARAGHTAVWLPTGKALVVGGCTGDAALASAELYDPTMNIWTPAASLREARCWHTATLLPDGQVLVVGGRDSRNQALASAELYDPKANAWTPAAAPQASRQDHTATLLPDGSVLVVGGYNGRYLTDAERYDTARNAWSPAGSLNTARAYHSATLLRNGTVLVAGGANGSRPRASVELYDPQTRAWTAAAALPAPYEAHRATLLRDGRVLITGRPGSNDPTGNDGRPQPTATPTTSSNQSRMSRGPTPTPGIRAASNSTAGSAVGLSAKGGAPLSLSSLQTAPPAALGNVTIGAGTARLYGMHEVSFTLSNTLYSNPYTLTTTFIVTFTLPGGETEPVLAFYDGPGGAGRDLWKARVYVNRVGYWSWTPPAGARDYVCNAACGFPAIEQPQAALHGMLRVVSETQTIASPPTPTSATYIQSQAIHVGTSKRWYTDDGHTFLPMADTAYRLFFEVPVTSTPAIPASYCPTMTLTSTNAYTFVHQYAEAVAARGVNVLRVESLGTWAYTDEELARVQMTRTDDCNTDLSLFWSSSIIGSNHDLFGGGPSITGTQSITLYPNLQSFQRTDRRLTQLLNEFPGLYIQILLVPEPLSNRWDHDWLYRPADGAFNQAFSPGVSANLRMQLWRTMAARWAAFPNVFWSISNDLGDANATGPDHKYQRTYPNNRALADEIGSYFAGITTPAALPDPWHEGRPMSLGHLRNEPDSFKTAPWHTYITAYSAADISAQQMDGAVVLPESGGTDETTCSNNPYQIANILRYSDEITPTYNVEDYYENPEAGDISNPSYFFRRLFWSYLLSGGGATFGAGATYAGTQTYVTAGLTGLNSVQYISRTLDAAGADLNLFEPADNLVSMNPPESGLWAAYNRPQVARRGKQEILAYIPNTLSRPSVYCPDRKQADPATTQASVVVSMTTFTNTQYAVTWYNPATGSAVPVNSIVGTNTVTLTVPSPPTGFTGDAILHISSRCVAPNACLSMDMSPSPYITWTNSFLTRLGSWNGQTATLNLDSAQRVSGSASWRCDRPVGVQVEPAEQPIDCRLYYVFPLHKPVATADFYFRRNSSHGHQSVEFITSPAASGPITITDNGWPATGIDVGVNPEQDLFTDWGESGTPVTLNIRHNIPLESNRWYHLEAKATVKGSNVPDRRLEMEALLDGVSVFTSTEYFRSGDQYLRGVVLHSAWWGAIDDLDSETMPSIWWDDVRIDPPPDADLLGLYRTFFQQGLGGYVGNPAIWFDASGGYNATALLRVGANNIVKSLLRFDLSALPTETVIDEATLQIYYTSRSNGNTLTLGAHRVLADWVDSQANWTQRKTGVNWNVGGMGSGSDYTATAEATAALTGAGGAWVELDLTNAAQAWIADPAGNKGLVLLQEAASGYVTYDFCSELGWSPCTAAQAPRLTLRYHHAAPAPAKATFQQGGGGYSGNNATYFDTTYGYNNAYRLQVGANNAIKALLKFDVSTIPAGKKVDEATLRLYYTGRSNSNALTIGAHRVLAAWTDSQANWNQRQTGVNWQAAGMGSGSDYLAAADGSVDVLGNGGSWIELDVSDMAQVWIDNAADNKGLVALAEAASGSVVYDFCSELGWSPCTAAQAPKLTIWYH